MEQTWRLLSLKVYLLAWSSLCTAQKATNYLVKEAIIGSKLTLIQGIKA
jgi:hypothetical protein